MCNFLSCWPENLPDFSLLVSSFFLLFQGHLLIGNKWLLNMICVTEGSKIRDAIIWLHMEEEYYFSGKLLFAI